MADADKSPTLPSNEGSTVDAVDGAKPVGNEDDDSSKRTGKRPRRSTQSVDYACSDEDENQNDDVSIASAECVDHKNDGKNNQLDDASLNEDELGGNKPTKGRKRRKRARKSEGNESFECPHCKKSFKTQLGLQYHVDKFVCREEDGTPKIKKKDQPPKKRIRKSSPNTVGDRTCPHCKVVFKTMPGLKYHTENKVCLRVQAAQAQNVELRPFPTLNRGQKFVTQFGIVEVVKDDRAVPTATYPEGVQALYRKYQKFKAAEDAKSIRQYARIASKFRVRRNAINAIYEKGKANRRSIFGAYFGGDPEHIRSVINANKVLESGSSNTASIKSPQDINPRSIDPKEPKDSFPDRIVECILVPDERTHHLDLMKTKVTRNAKQGPTKLYLQRKVLKEVYEERDSVYQCQDCGRRFGSSQARKPHCEYKKCIHDAKIKKEKREALQFKIDREVEIAERFPERRKFIINKNPSTDYKRDGRKRKWRKKKKAERSVYPEVVIDMGFKLVTKKKINIEVGSPLKSSLPIQEKGRNVNTILDDLKGALDAQKRKTSDQVHGSIYAGVYRALGFKKPKRARIQNALGKRKRAKRATKPKPLPPPRPLPPAIDIAALVDEIKSGRYPSFVNYEGEHGDTCVLCKNGGMMYCCEFCGNAEHFECVLARFTIKEPEPDEDFMCHQCIGIILSRRARAEKRRLRRQAKTEQLQKEEEEKNPSNGNEYPYMASQGRDVSELVELLKDAQIRLRRSIETTKLNNIRRQVIAGVYPDEYSPPY